MSITIRPYQPKDRPILELLSGNLVDFVASLDPHRLFLPKRKLDTKKYTTWRLKHVKQKHGVIFLAFDKKQPVGYLAATLESNQSPNKVPIRLGVVDALFVEEAFRSQGVASELVKKAEIFFRKAKCTHSCIGCLATNTNAREFYQHCGYTEQFVDLYKKLS